MNKFTFEQRLTKVYNNTHEKYHTGWSTIREFSSAQEALQYVPKWKKSIIWSENWYKTVKAEYRIVHIDHKNITVHHDTANPNNCITIEE